jgi:hypothetical protein
LRKISMQNLPKDFAVLHNLPWDKLPGRFRRVVCLMEDCAQTSGPFYFLQWDNPPFLFCNEIKGFRSRA